MECNVINSQIYFPVRADIRANNSKRNKPFKYRYILAYRHIIAVCKHFQRNGWSVLSAVGVNIAYTLQITPSDSHTHKHGTPTDLSTQCVFFSFRFVFIVRIRWIWIFYVEPTLWMNAYVRLSSGLEISSKNRYISIMSRWKIRHSFFSQYILDFDENAADLALCSATIRIWQRGGLGLPTMDYHYGGQVHLDSSSELKLGKSLLSHTTFWNNKIFAIFCS